MPGLTGFGFMVTLLSLRSLGCLGFSRDQRLMRTVFGWLLLVSGSWLLGAVLNELASRHGLIELANDRRGEWSAVTTPIIASVGVLLSYCGARRLILKKTCRPWHVAGAAALVVILSLCWLTWRFHHAV
ncbi:hypothetical protein [Xanthomonas sacchari]|uniref:hypothetical protein n=1 Tax=Xanthomonas sacchari TaxID=56458 RepID=UPI000581EB98|nr:hypothetical protein [Xanthomonas sacchari]AJC46378.1 hypothetical protein SB85_12040 [Xanthomonas sacchari]